MRSVQWTWCSRSALALAVLVALVLGRVDARAQSVGKFDRIGLGGSNPSTTSALVIDPADVPANTAGQNLLFLDGSGLARKGTLAKGDLPAVVGYTDEAETWTLLQTFTSGLTTNGPVTIGGANDLILGTGGMRVTGGSILLRNIADTATIAGFGDTSITLSQPTVMAALVSFSGSGLRATTSPLIIRNSGDTANLATFGNAAIDFVQPVTASSTLGVTGATTLSSTLGVTGLATLTGGFTSGAASQVNSTLGITGLTTAAKIRTTGVYGVASPFTVFAADGVTSRMEIADAGVSVLTDTGTNTSLEFRATGNTSGQRAWRIGNLGGAFGVQGGTDAYAYGSGRNLFRATEATGVPNGWFWGDAVASVSPDVDFTTNLGAYATQYANLWIRNLWATTLVAQDVISTIGGAVLVTPTTKVELAVTAGTTSFQTTHNEMAPNDVAYISENLATEFVQVTAGPIAGASSISYISNAEAVGTAITIPAHQVGDLIVIFAFANTGNVPALGAGFTNVANCNASGGTTGSRVGYMVADTTSEVSGTWTNATSLMVHLYRFSNGVAAAPGACAVSNASASTSLVYPALTLSKTDHSSWVARAAIASAGTNIQTAPTGYSLRANNTAVPETASFDSNGRILDTSVAASAGLTITSANWRALTLEIVGTGLTPYTYTVTRGYGGVFAARAWPAGVALANTGTTGDGGMNLYAIQSIKGSGERGPTIQGYERTSGTYNALSTRWALGNLYGLYNYGAVDVYGAAFGNAADTWVGIDASNGVRFFDAGTTLNAQFATDATITLGQTGSGQANTIITPTALSLRRGAVEQVKLSATGLEMFDATPTRRVLLDASGLLLGTTGAGEENMLITSTSIFGRVASTNWLEITSTAGMVIGEVATNKGNVYIDTSGNLTLRSGTSGAVNRIRLGADAAIRIYDDDGTTERVHIGATDAYFGSTTAARLQYTYSNGRVNLYDGGANVRLWADATNGLVLGPGSNGSGKPYAQLTDTQLLFCEDGGGCPLAMNGSTGDITSSGNIVLSTGGNISSTGNWSITQTGGLAFTGVTSFATAKSVQFLNSSVGSRVWGGGSGNDGYLWLETKPSSYTGGLKLTHVNSTAALTIEALSSGIGSLVEFTKNSINTGYIGSSGVPWDRVYATTFYAGASAGASGAMFLVGYGGGTCQVNFSGGLIISHNCPTTFP